MDSGGDVHRLELADDGGGGPASSSKASLLSRSLSMVSAATYNAKKTVAQGMMDIALLTANANQLRYILEFRDDEATNFAVLLVLIVCSLVLQVNTRHGRRPEGTDDGGSKSLVQWRSCPFTAITQRFIAIFGKIYNRVFATRTRSIPRYQYQPWLYPAIIFGGREVHIYIKLLPI